MKIFLSLLSGFEVLVDVRSVPFCKYVPQFSTINLKRTLESIGIKYEVIVDEFVCNVLDGRPRDDDSYLKGKVIYEEIMIKDWKKEGISALINIASKKKTVIMYSEEDPYKCHRHHLITQSLLKKGVTVFHIRGHGEYDRIEKPEKKMIQLTFT